MKPFLPWLMLLAFITAARSEEVTADPWQVIHIARSFGDADVVKDALGDPMIMGRAGPTRYSIAFYGCKLGRECSSFLFSTQLPSRPTAKLSTVSYALSRWNREKVFGRAYVDDDGSVVLDHALALPVAAPTLIVHAALATWLDAVVELAEVIDSIE